MSYRRDLQRVASIELGVVLAALIVGEGVSDDLVAFLLVNRLDDFLIVFLDNIRVVVHAAPVEVLDVDGFAQEHIVQDI